MSRATHDRRRALAPALIILIAVLAGAAHAAPAAAQFGPVTPPARVFGNVSVAGRPAPGATVVALIGSSVCGTTTAAADGSYQVDVRSAAVQAGCGVDGAVVTFSINGRPARETVVYQSGGFIQRDLSAGAAVAEVLVERWARFGDEPCANPVDSWCISTYALPPAREPFAYYRMLAVISDGRIEQATDWITVAPNTPTASVTVRRERGVERVRWERWSLLGGTPCAGRIDDFWCVEAVEVAPPITGTVWYRLLVRQPDGRTDDPTGFIPASP